MLTITVIACLNMIVMTIKLLPIPTLLHLLYFVLCVLYTWK